MQGWVPHLSWPSAGRWDDFTERWDLSDSERVSMEQVLKGYKSQIDKLTKSGKLHEDSLKKLETMIPKIVHMPLRDGSPKISEDFWHSLRDLIREDGGIMIFDKKGSDYAFASEEHWKAISSRLLKDPVFSAKVNRSLSLVENRLSDKMAGSWDTWVKNNNGIVSDILGSELDKIQAAGSDGEFDKRLSKIVRNHLHNGELGGVVVSRDEFLQHLKKEFAIHRAEVRAELAELHPQLETQIQEYIKMATENVPRGMSKADVTSLVQALVRKTVADMNLGPSPRARFVPIGTTF